MVKRKYFVSKLLIGGGFNNVLGNCDKVYNIDIHSGYVNNLPSLSKPGWTVLQPVYLNGTIRDFICVEESNKFPEEIIYSFTIPL